MGDENSSLTTQCLAFCQALASKGQAINFKLTLGNSFSFSLDTIEKTLAQEARKKKVSPSTQKRNLLRRKKFFESKNNPSTQILEKATKSTETLKHCELCDFVASSERVLEIHMVKKHMNIDQLDGNTSLDTTFENKETQTDDLDTKSSENAKRIEDNEQAAYSKEKSKTEPEQEEMICPICDIKKLKVKFDRTANLKDHILLHWKKSESTLSFSDWKTEYDILPPWL